MHNPKKHPLEIFREHGGRGPLLPRGGGATPSSMGAFGDDPAQRAGTPVGSSRARLDPAPFELRLSLFGAVMLALAWIVLLAAAYSIGVKRGRQELSADGDKVAQARGADIEKGDASGNGGESGARPPVALKPFGVQLVTYTRATSNIPEKCKELTDTLISRYKIPASDLHVYTTKDGETAAVFIGNFWAKDDPALIDLEARMHKIDDWPFGNKSPFATAEVRYHWAMPKLEPVGTHPSDAADKNE